MQTHSRLRSPAERKFDLNQLSADPNMNPLWHFLFAILLFFSSPLFADQLIIEPDMGRKPILDAIYSSKHKLNLVMYGFTDPDLRDAIINKHAEGKTVKVILEDQPYKAERENSKTISLFNQNRINWQGNLPSFRLIHQKTLLIDDAKAIVMTFNFTSSSFQHERNFALIMDDPGRVKAISSLFAADWNHLAYENTNSSLIISPDNSRNKLLELIQDAGKSIKIYAQGISDYKIIGALANAARNSVDVQILTSKHLSQGIQDYLHHAGVKIYYTKMMIHAKVFIIDGQKAVIGSINLTRQSLDDNRELSVITEDRSVISDLNKTFNQDLTYLSHPAVSGVSLQSRHYS